MYQYVCFNKDGQEVFDYNELSLEQRANFKRLNCLFKQFD